MRRNLKSISRLMPAAALSATLAVACAKGGHKSSPSPAPVDPQSVSEDSDQSAEVHHPDGTEPARDGIPCSRLRGTWITRDSREKREGREVITISQTGCESVAISTGPLGKPADTLVAYETNGERQPLSDGSWYRALYHEGNLVIYEMTVKNGGDLQKDCVEVEKEVDNPYCLVVRKEYALDGGNSSKLTVTLNGETFDSDGKAEARTAIYRSGVNHVVQPKPAPKPSPSPAESRNPYECDPRDIFHTYCGGG